MTRERDGARRAALVCNPVKADAGRLEELTSREALEAGWDAPLLLRTTRDDAGDGAAAEALRQEADVVIVAGGDGTVRSVAESVASTGVPMAIVPSGTGNLLARNLALPLTSPAAMVHAAFVGDVHAIDVGLARLVRIDATVDEHAFVVIGGIGLDAAMIANTSPQLKKAMGWIAYVDGAARSLPGAKPFRVEFDLERGRLHTAKVHSMLFANCGALPAGIALVPDASIVDGRMDVTLVQPTGPFGWLGVWRKVWWDNSVLRRTRAGRLIVQRHSNTSVRYLRSATVEVAAETAQPVQLDGDEFGRAVRMRCTILPGALHVAVPAGHHIPGL